MPEAWNDDIERLGRQAAEHYHPDAAAPDWQLIEQKLDLAMPVEKKKRRRAIFFWLFAGISLCIAYGIYELNPTTVLPDAQPVASKAAETQNTTTTKSVNIEKVRTSKTQKNTAQTPTSTFITAQPDKISAAGKKVFPINIRKNISPEAQVSDASYSSRKTNTNTTAVSVEGISRNSSVFMDDTITSKQNNKVEEKSTSTEQSTDTSIASSTLQKSALENQANNLDTTPSSPKKIEPKTTKTTPSKWEIGLVYGMDASTVKFKYWDQPGTNAGIVIGIPLNNHWSLRTGAIMTRKQYKVAGEDYTLKTYWPNAKLYWVNGFCDMWEIPIQFRYTAKPEKKWSWFTAAGLSSYLMKKENYNYYLSVNNGQPYLRHVAYDTSRNYPMGIASFSAGLRARIHERLFFEVEPFARLPLGGVGSGNIKLMSLGVYTSLIIRPFNQSKKQ